jgi:hypothetical protein
MRRAVRALRQEGEVPERIEIDLDGNFTIVIAKKDTPESEVDLIHGLDGEAAALSVFPDGAGSISKNLLIRLGTKI